MKNINNYLLLFCFAALSLGQIARFDLLSGVAVTLLDIALVLFVGYNSYFFVREKKIQGTLLKPIGYFVTACLLSLVVNAFVLSTSQLLIASLYLLRWILYAGVYVSVLRMKSLKEDTIIKLLVVSGVFHLLVGFLQYFFFSDLRNLYYLGWDDHLYRLVGALVDPNFQGAFFVLLFSLFFILFMRRIKEVKSRKSLVLGILMLLTLSEIVLTYSRSALVMFAVCLFLFFLYTGNKKIILSLSGVALLFTIIFSNTYIEGLNPFRTASINARISSIQEVAVIIRDNPIFGVGFNAFRYAQNRYGFRTSELWQTSHADAGTDNSFLFVFATTGIVGLTAYLFLLWHMLQLIKGKITKKGIVPLLTLVSISGLIVDSLFVNSLFYTFFMFWIWILVAATENT